MGARAFRACMACCWRHLLHDQEVVGAAGVAQKASNAWSFIVPLFTISHSERDPSPTDRETSDKVAPFLG